MGDLLWESLYDPYAGFSMAETAENLADKYGLKRAEVDDFAYQSQMRTQAAREAGKFGDEIVPVEVVTKKDTRRSTPTSTRVRARRPRSWPSSAVLQEGRRRDPGNASGIVDGAAAVFVTTRARAERRMRRSSDGFSAGGSQAATRRSWASDPRRRRGKRSGIWVSRWTIWISTRSTRRSRRRRWRS